ncbi:MAG: hypothetical protein KC713_09095, partial [Candidatus Omnitrophica bacterium]|nr:hypothetical protein [Candidatus Omnitrophota bacterium]
NTFRAIQEANEKECASNIRAVNTAIQLCFTDVQNWETCANLGYLEEEGFLEDEVICPFGVDYTFEDAPNGVGQRVAATSHFANWPDLDGDHVSAD